MISSASPTVASSNIAKREDAPRVLKLGIAMVSLSGYAANMANQNMRMNEAKMTCDAALSV